MHPHRNSQKPDDLGARVEVAKGIGFGHQVKIEGDTADFNLFSSDSALLTINRHRRFS